MANEPARPDPVQPQPAPRAAPRPLLGDPASEERWLVPIAVFTFVLMLTVLGFVFLPLHRAVRLEPDPTIKAVLADQVYLLHIRLWPLVALAAMVAASGPPSRGRTWWDSW
mgnify:CR=1 FL=1